MPDIETCKLMTDWVKILGAVVVFLIGLYQYTRAQKWKRREFIASQIKDFEADKAIQATMKMLDWHDREIPFPSETETKPLIIRVNDQLLCSALLPHDSAVKYTRDEARIRDCFDKFLDMLVRLSNFVEAHLIGVDELRPYILYWIQLISGAKPEYHTPEFYALLLNHIKIYNFEGAATLITSFGYNASASDAVLEKAITETMARRVTPHSAADHGVKSDKMASGLAADVSAPAPPGELP